MTRRLTPRNNANAYRRPNNNRQREWWYKDVYPGPEVGWNSQRHNTHNRPWTISRSRMARHHQRRSKERRS